VSDGLVVAGHVATRRPANSCRSPLPLNRQLSTTPCPGLAAASWGASAQPPPLGTPPQRCPCSALARRACDREAAAEGHLSELSGIGGKAPGAADRAGPAAALRDLAGAEPEQLADGPWRCTGEQHRRRSPPAWLAQAGCSSLGTAALRLEASPGPGRPEGGPPGLLLLTTSKSDPRWPATTSLHGFLRIKRQADGSCRPQTEGSSNRLPVLRGCMEHGGKPGSWQGCAVLLEYASAGPLLHYGETETVSLCRGCAHAAGGSGAEVQPLRGRMIDLPQKRSARHWLIAVSRLRPSRRWQLAGLPLGQKAWTLGPAACSWWRQCAAMAATPVAAAVTTC